MSRHRRRRRREKRCLLPSFCICLAHLQTTAALSLANFQIITPSSVTPLCLAIYEQLIDGCTPKDFTSPAGCSAGCISGLRKEADAIHFGCGRTNITETSLLGLTLQGLLVEALCPGSKLLTSSLSGGLAAGTRSGTRTTGILSRPTVAPPPLTISGITTRPGPPPPVPTDSSSAGAGEGSGTSLITITITPTTSIVGTLTATLTVSLPTTNYIPPDLSSTALPPTAPTTDPLETSSGTSDPEVSDPSAAQPTIEPLGFGGGKGGGSPFDATAPDMGQGTSLLWKDSAWALAIALVAGLVLLK